MNPDIADTYATMIEELQPLAAALREAFPKPIELPPPPPIPTVYETPDALRAAMQAAEPGATLLISPSLVYPDALTLTKSVTLKNSAIVDGRMTPDFPCPRFLNGIDTPGDSIALVGLEITHTQAQNTVVQDTGTSNRVDRCRILGDPVKGQRRGIAANGINGVYTRNYIARVFSPKLGSWTDSNGICAWDTPGPVTITDNYVEASSEGIMIGGSDPSGPGRDPSDVTIIGNWVTKDLAWRALGHIVKNGVEFKNCRRFLFEDNDVENVWGGAGQDGAALVLTVHNQEGRNWTATIQDGVIRKNRFRHAAAGIIVLALEDIKESKTGVGRVPIGEVRPSIRMKNVTLDENAFTDINPKVWYPEATSPKLIAISGGPIDFTLKNTLFEAVGFSSAIYFNKGPKAENMNVTGCWLPATKYGVFGAGASVNGAWALFVASGEFSNNVVQ